MTAKQEITCLNKLIAVIRDTVKNKHVKFMTFSTYIPSFYPRNTQHVYGAMCDPELMQYLTT